MLILQYTRNMRRNLITKITGGMLFGTGIIAIFGIYFLVRAVAPGVVQNPTFGPLGDDVQLQFKLECVTGLNAGGGTSIYPSSLGNTYPFSQVFTASGVSTLTCINGWALTGCASQSTSGDNDDSMSGQNTCAGDNDGGDTGFARCCRAML